MTTTSVSLPAVDELQSTGSTVASIAPAADRRDSPLTKLSKEPDVVKHAPASLGMGWISSGNAHLRTFSCLFCQSYIFHSIFSNPSVHMSFSGSFALYQHQFSSGIELP